MKRARIALLHEQLGYGGSERVTLSIAEALQDDYEVSLITTRRAKARIDLARLNSFCDTAVDATKVAVVEALLPAILRSNFAALRGGVFGRFCRRLARRFDVMFMTYGVMDMGVRGIQLIHDPLFNPELHRRLSPFPSGWRGRFYEDSLPRKIYLGLSRWVAESSPEGIRRNLTLVSSEWTAKIVRDFYGVETRTVYPPVAGEFPDVAWAEREDGFVCVGRWTAEKRMERAIRILGEVRQSGARIHLHLIGSGGDPRYLGTLRELCRANPEWVCMEEGVNSQTKARIMASHKYGLSTRENEPFGIGVGEMVKAGCVVFVAGGGGQTEIIDHPQLIFRDDEEAVGKIQAVLSSGALQDALCRHLAAQARKFSVGNFRGAMRAIVAEFLQIHR
jgi:glycosyltransferase involved in cell wall biosynthesis